MRRLPNVAFDAETFVQISDPDHRGRVTLTWNDQVVEIEMNWATMKLMQTAFGQDFIATVSNALDQALIADLERMVSMCARRPGQNDFIPRDEIEEWNFPINPMRDALQIAWTMAWNGGEIPDPNEQAEDEGKKRKGPLTWLRQRLSDALRPD